MKHIFSFGFWAALCVAGGALSLAQQRGLTAERRAAAPLRNSDPFLTGAPFTLDQVQRLLSQDAIPIRRRKEAIQARGVDFSFSNEVIDQLKKAGATSEMMDVIESKAKPATVPVPSVVKHVPTGGLIASCEPAECEIKLNGVQRGWTDHGVMELAGITPGNWSVDFSKDGYVGKQSTVSIEADKKGSVSAILSANRATQEAFGAAMLGKAIEALGGEDGLRAISSVQASGSTTILRNGTSVRLSLLMRNRPDRTLFQAKAGAVLYELMFTGNEFMASKNLKGQVAMDLPTDMGFIRDYQLAAMVTRLKDPRYKLVAKQTEPHAGEPFSLFAEASTEKVSVGFDSQSRPERVRIETETGVGSVTIVYSEYFKTGVASYPKTIQIKPEGRERGIEVRFDNIELDTDLKDNDYKLRGKALPSLAN